MLLKPWEQLPDCMRTDAVKPYYDALRGHAGALLVKRGFDFAIALALLLLLWPAMLIIAALIRLDSSGPAIFRQERVTTYGRRFRILKFRTMTASPAGQDVLLTSSGDIRITRVGTFLRRTRLDELPQLINILAGDMTFVGTRPEVPRYVMQYRPAYYATLLLPAGLTSEASIRFKDEGSLLADAQDADSAYTESILPEKMALNLASIARFNLRGELGVLVRTVLAVLKKD